MQHVLAVTDAEAPKLFESVGAKPYDSIGTSPGATRPFGRVEDWNIMENVTPIWFE